MEPQDCLIAERCKDRWRSRVRRLPCSVWQVEMDPIGHKQDRGRVPPDWLEPRRLRARMQQCYSVAVLSETRDPGAYRVSIERRIEIDETLARGDVVL
jgi:hypothetical protein